MLVQIQPLWLFGKPAMEDLCMRACMYISSICCSAFQINKHMHRNNSIKPELKVDTMVKTVLDVPMPHQDTLKGQASPKSNVSVRFSFELDFVMALPSDVAMLPSSPVTLG